MYFQNISNNPHFENILARLAPFEQPLEQFLQNRQVFALMAVGSVPAGYAQVQSDLDLVAFVDDRPLYTHIFENGCISIREVSWAYIDRELTLCLEISQVPITFVILPCALLFLLPEREKDFVTNMKRIQATCATQFLEKILGEVRCGQRLHTGMAGTDVYLSWEQILGYPIFVTSLANPALTRKINRMRSQMSLSSGISVIVNNLPTGWQADEKGVWLLSSASGTEISFVSFAFSVLANNLRRFMPPNKIRGFYIRQAQLHFNLGGHPFNQSLQIKMYSLAKRKQLFLETCRMLFQPNVRHQYGRLIQSLDGGNCYDGLGKLFWYFVGGQ